MGGPGRRAALAAARRGTVELALRPGRLRAPGRRPLAARGAAARPARPAVARRRGAGRAPLTPGAPAPRRRRGARDRRRCASAWPAPAAPPPRAAAPPLRRAGGRRSRRRSPRSPRRRRSSTPGSPHWPRRARGGRRRAGRPRLRPHARPATTCSPGIAAWRHRTVARRRSPRAPPAARRRSGSPTCAAPSAASCPSRPLARCARSAPATPASPVCAHGRCRLGRELGRCDPLGHRGRRRGSARVNEIGPNFIARPYRGVSVQDVERSSRSRSRATWWAGGSTGAPTSSWPSATGGARSRSSSGAGRRDPRARRRARVLAGPSEVERAVREGSQAGQAIAPRHPE